LCYPGSGEFIYALRGDDTNNAWKYNITNNSWVTINSTPDTVNNGGSLCWPGAGGDIYALRGDASTDFWKFNITDETWVAVNATPGAVNTALYQGGHKLCYPAAGDYIYAVSGTSFWKI